MIINFLNLPKRLKRREKTETAGHKSSQSTDDSASERYSNMESSENKETERRLQDILSKDHPKRKMNLDRRTPHSERRTDTNHGYNGPARRYTIDRRQSMKDRRDQQ